MRSSGSPRAERARSSTVALGLAVALLGPAGGALARLPGETGALTVGVVLDDELLAGEQRVHRVEMAAGDGLYLRIEQDAIDVNLCLVSEDDSRACFDTPTGTDGPESAWWVAEVPEVLRIVVRGVYPTDSGVYRLRVDQLGPAQPADRDRARAYTRFREGIRHARAARFEASLSPFREAAALFDRTGELDWQVQAVDWETSSLQELGRWEESVAVRGALLEAAEGAGREDLLLRLGASQARILLLVDDLEGALRAAERAEVAFGAVREQREHCTAARVLAELFRSLADSDLEGRWRREQAAVCERQGSYSLAVQALACLAQDARDLDRPRAALALLDRASRLPTSPDFRHHSPYWTMAELYADLGRPSDALRWHEPMAGHPSDAVARARGAAVLRKSGEAERAAEYARQATEELRRAEAEGSEVFGRVAWAALARYHADASDLGAEIGALERVLGYSSNHGETVATSIALAEALHRAGRSDEALAQARTTVAHIERFRGVLGTTRHAMNWSAFHRRAHDLLVDLWMARANDDDDPVARAAALTVAESARAVVLRERLAASLRDGPIAAPAELVEREARLSRRIELLDRRLSYLLTAGTGLASVRAELRRSIEETADDLSDVRERMLASTSPVGSTLGREPLSVGRIQAELLDPDTAVLEYWVGERRTHVWWVATDGFHGWTVDVERADLSARVARVRQQTAALADPTDAVSLETELSELAGILLGPLTDGLRRPRLVVVPDGPLESLPFAALPWPSPTADVRERLVERHSLVTVPSLASLAIDRRRPRPAAERRACVLYDPIYSLDDARVRPEDRAEAERAEAVLLRGLEEAIGRGERLPRLAGTRREAEAIAEIVPPKELWSASGAEATAESVLDGELERCELVHFGTHAFASQDRPELSVLVMSLLDDHGRVRKGMLRSHEIQRLHLASELVVLSACDTALGRSVAGEGTLGITRSFLYAGARRVLSSLWEVADRPTAELMDRFYRGLLVEGLGPDVALQRAQSSMAAHPVWSSPYFWAGFTLTGDWRPIESR